MHRNIVEEILHHLSGEKPILLIGPENSGKTSALISLKNVLLNQSILNKKILLIDIAELALKNPNFESSNFSQIKRQLGLSNSLSYILIDDIHLLPDPFKFIKQLHRSASQSKLIITSSIDYRIFNPNICKEWIILPINYLTFMEFLNLKKKEYLKKTIIPYSIPELAKGILVENKTFLAMFEEEIKAMFTEYITYGGIPRVVSANSSRKGNEIRNIYNNIYKVINKTAHFAYPPFFLKNIEYLKSILTYLAYNIGEPVNFSRIVEELNISRPTVEKCLNFLEAFQFIKKVLPYHTNKPKEIIKRAKYYVVDCGLYNYIVGNFNPLETRLYGRKLVENYIFITLNNIRSLKQIRYWQIKSKANVDFVLSTKTLIPLVLLYQDISYPKVSTGLRHFIREYNPRLAIIITKEFLGKGYYQKTLIFYVPMWLIN